MGRHGALLPWVARLPSIRAILSSNQTQTGKVGLGRVGAGPGLISAGSCILGLH